MNIIQYTHLFSHLLRLNLPLNKKHGEKLKVSFLQVVECPRTGLTRVARIQNWRRLCKHDNKVMSPPITRVNAGKQSVTRTISVAFTQSRPLSKMPPRGGNL